MALGPNPGVSKTLSVSSIKVDLDLYTYMSCTGTCTGRSTCRSRRRLHVLHVATCMYLDLDLHACMQASLIVMIILLQKFVSTFLFSRYRYWKEPSSKMMLSNFSSL